ncbi:MAG: hypothetical protein WD276_01310 [Actinomycetota bacterium]
MQKGKWIAIVLGGIVLIALFVILRPKGETGGNGGSAPARAEVAVSDGRVDGPDTLETTVGSKVSIVVHSDTAGKVHIHGYEKLADVSAGGTATLSFVADAAGRFEVEFHGGHEGGGTEGFRGRSKPKHQGESHPEDKPRHDDKPKREDKPKQDDNPSPEDEAGTTPETTGSDQHGEPVGTLLLLELIVTP